MGNTPIDVSDGDPRPGENRRERGDTARGVVLFGTLAALEADLVRGRRLGWGVLAVALVGIALDVTLQRYSRWKGQE